MKEEVRTSPGPGPDHGGVNCIADTREGGDEEDGGVD